EGRHLPGLLVVERDVADEVLDDGEGPHRGDRDGLVLGEGRHPGHAAQPGLAVDLHGAGAALAGLAVPAHGQVGGLGGLEPVDDVEDDLALVHLDGEVFELAFATLAAPDPELRLVTHFAILSNSAISSSVRYLLSSSRSNSEIRSSRIAGCSCSSTVMEVPSSVEQTSSLRRHSGRMPGWSSRVWPPRLSSRSSAALATHSDTRIMLRRSSARCQPGL